jgi:hypothetical protein
VPEVVEADAAKASLAEERGEGAGEVGRVDRPALRRSENVSTSLPFGASSVSLRLLMFAVQLQRVEATGWEGDAAFGGPRLGGQGLEPARVDAVSNPNDTNSGNRSPPDAPSTP